MATRSTLNVSLTPALDAFVQENVTSGRFQSASEVVREALRRLQDDQQQRQAAIAKLNADVQLGCDQVRRGEVVDGETVFAELRERSRRHRAEHS